MTGTSRSEMQEATTIVDQKAAARDSSCVIKPDLLTLIENFRLMDDDFMSKCLENAPECIELMLRIILSKKDLKVVTSQTEYPIKSLQGRGVRFDVFARDSEGKEYDIELQRDDRGAEPKRARYNSALMDANALESGKDFGKLRETFVIFITENDVMKRGQEVYEYDRIEKVSGEYLGDGTHIIYVNGETRSDSEIGKLVHDLLCRNEDEMHFEILKKRVSQFKNSEEGRQIMCKAVEEYGDRRAAEAAAEAAARGKAEGRAEGRAEGKAEGRAEGRAEGEAQGKLEAMIATARRMLANGKLMLQEVADFSGLSLAQIERLQAEMA